MKQNLKRRMAVLMTAGALLFCLSGCSTLSDRIGTWTLSAQDKVDALTSYASADLSAATTLAGTDELNYPAAAQCLPVLSAWLVKLKTEADRYREVRGAVTATVYRHWAENTLTKGVPESVSLACSAMWVSEKGDFSDALTTVKKLLGK